MASCSTLLVLDGVEARNIIIFLVFFLVCTET